MTKPKSGIQAREAVRTLKRYAFTLAASGLVTTLVHCGMTTSPKMPVGLGE